MQPTENGGDISYMHIPRTLFLMIVLGLFIHVVVLDVEASISTEEYQALVAIYNSTNGTNWINQTGWLTDPNPCNWYGIVCQNDHVISIDLSSNQLSGQIPPEISNLSQLNLLILAVNQLSGEIPAGIGNLSNLNYLLLNENQLTGAIPESMGNLTNLIDLYLTDNQLTGTIPTTIGNLTALETLALGRNSLTGQIPVEIGNLTSLNSIYLGETLLSGTIPSIITNLSQLMWLDISSSQLTGNIPSNIGDLTGLWYLNLSHNQLTGSIPVSVGNLSLNIIDLSYNSLSGQIPVELGSSYYLEILNLSHNHLSGSLPPTFQYMEYLLEVDLSSNQLEGTLPTWTRNWRNLQRLSLDANQFDGVIPYFIISSPYLYHLDIGYNRLTSTDDLIAWINNKDPDWQQTQTVPPTNVAVANFSANTVELTWTPILYTGDDGYYEVRYSTIDDGNYPQVGCVTGNKLATGCTVTGLETGETYYFVVRTFTPAHGDQQNDLWSAYSSPIHAVPDFCGTVTDVPFTECTALSALYNSTNGPEWINNSGWMSDPLVCSWYGISCSSGSVSEISLIGNQLAGNIPGEIGYLSELNILDLSNNQLTGSIPQQLLTNTTLVRLTLNDNQITGTIPSELGNQTGLRTLWLYNNQLSGSIPGSLGNLSYLFELDLSNNQLSGSIPPELGNLQVQSLILANNQLTGSIPPEIGNLAVADTLDLSNNQLSGSIPPEFANILPLRYLALSHNQLTGTIPIALTGHPFLTYVALDNNQFIGEMPSHITNLTKLRPTYSSYLVTDFGYNGWYSNDPSVITFLNSKDLDWQQTQTVPPTNVAVANFSANTVELTWTPILYTGDDGYYEVRYSTIDDGSYPQIGCVTANKLATGCTVTGLETGETYYFVVRTFTSAHGDQQNDLWSVYSSSIQAVPDFCGTVTDVPFTECKALVALYKSTDGANWINNRGWMSDPLVCSWYGISCQNGYVTGVELSANLAGGVISPQIWNLTNLRYLDLSNNLLPGEIPTSIGNLVNLIELDLGSNDLTGSIPTTIGNLLHLEKLNLSWNIFMTGEIPEEIGNLTNLRYLYISQTQLGGEILASIVNMTNLIELDLLANQFTGSMPPGIGNLTNLRYLNLEGNQFSGEIPAEIGDMTSLEYMALGWNQFNGEIPESIGNLTNLYWLRLTSTQLIGEIPATIVNLTTTDMDIGFNRLFSNDPSVITFLNSKNPDWQQTQTVPPANVAIANITANTIELSWTPILYTLGGGYYEVRYSTIDNGSYPQIGCVTANKLATGCTVTGLTDDQNYYFVVRTFTASHDWQPNDLWSVPGTMVSARTLAPNTMPFITANSDLVSVVEGQDATNTGSYSDPDDDPVTLNASAGTVIDQGNGNWSWSLIGAIPAHTQVVTITASDGNASVATSFQLVVLDLPPTDLQSSGITTTSISLTWLDNASSETGYRVERSENGGANWTEIAQLPANSTTYTDQSVVCESDYSYRVRTQRGVFFSAYSNTLSADTLPCIVAAPVLLQVATSNQTSMTLTWTDNATNESAYLLERSSDAGNNWLQIAALPANTTFHTDSNLICESGYSYRVRAYRNISDVYSAYSNTVSENTLPCAVLAPMNLQGDPEPFAITLSWQDAATNETDYFVERSLDSGGSWNQITQLAADTNQYTDRNLLCQTGYSYRVRAYRSLSGVYSDVAMIQAATANCPPLQTATVQVTAVTSSTVSLAWTLDTTATSAVLFVDTGQGWTQLGTFGFAISSFTHENLNCASLYQYRLQTQRQQDYSSVFTPITTASTTSCDPLVIPFAPIVTEIGRSTVGLRLSSVPQANNLRLERGFAGNWIQIAVINNGNSTYTDSSLMCSTTYDYRVRAYRSRDGIYSEYSPVVSISTSACPPVVSNTVGLYKDGNWIFRDTNNAGTADLAFQFGPLEAGWIALVGDWDGDGLDGIGLYKNGRFVLRNSTSSGPVDLQLSFGPAQSGWIPVVGDWNGDDIDTVGIYKDGIFLLTDNHATGQIGYRFNFGPALVGWYPLAGDWNGSGSDTVGIFRNGEWLLTNSVINPRVDLRFSFGPAQSGWQPLAGNWDATGGDGIGLYSASIWRLRNATSAGSTDIGFNFGQTVMGWQPLASFRGGISGAQALSEYANSLSLFAEPVVEPILALSPTALIPREEVTAVVTEPSITPTDLAIEPTVPAEEVPVEDPTPTPVVTDEPTPESTEP